MDPSARRLGDWTLIERIGQGGMGEVWRAERVGAGNVRRRAAVKRILDQYQSDPVLRERFIAEARINARLEHPNVAQVLDFGDVPELYLVLEFIEGAPASSLLSAGARAPQWVPPVAALYIVAEAATGLDYAHRRTDDAGSPLGIVHRDVSPSNILVSFDGSVKVNDFGIARAADNLLRTQAGLALGKLVYMAPEQSRGEALDHRADVFALGVVLWEFLTLKPLLPRNDTARALAMLAACDFAPPSQLRAGVPLGVDDLVRSMLSHDPARRPASGAHVAHALRTILATAAPGFGGRDLAHIVAQCLPEAFAARPSGPSLTAAFAPGAPAWSAPRALAPSPPFAAPAPSFVAPASPKSRVPVLVFGAAIGVAAMIAVVLAIPAFRRGSLPSIVPSVLRSTPPPTHECETLLNCCAVVRLQGEGYLRAYCEAAATLSAQHGEGACAAVLAQLSVREFPVGRWPATCGPPDMVAIQGRRCAQVAACCEALRTVSANPIVDALLPSCPGVVRAAMEESCAGVSATIRSFAAGGPSWEPLPAVCAQ